MNYLKEILTFENWLDYNSEINKSDIRLWYTLWTDNGSETYEEDTGYYHVPVNFCYS